MRLQATALCLLLTLGGSLVAPDSAVIAAAPGSAAATPIPPGNWVWYYQAVSQADASKFAGARAVVVGQQRDEAATASIIHSSGALAFHYMNTFWYPVTYTYQGINIGDHPEWAFCQNGSTPMVGRTVGSVAWDYVDLNESAMYDQVIAYLKTLQSDGYDGIFFDIAARSLRTGPMPNLVSTCIDDPVVPGATFAQAYAHVVEAAHAMGLRVVINYGIGPPLDPQLAPAVDFILRESPAHATPPAQEFAYRRLEQSRTLAGGTPYIEELKTSAPNNRAGAYYEWAEGALFQVNLDVNSGDDACKSGTFPELTAIDRGEPLDPQPVATRCLAPSTISCLWVRRWQKAVVVVNERPRSMTTYITTGQPTRRVLTNAWAGKSLAGGRPVFRARVTIPAFSGRVFTESG
jgi:hypothetical protein